MLLQAGFPTPRHLDRLVLMQAWWPARPVAVAKPPAGRRITTRLATGALCLASMLLAGSVAADSLRDKRILPENIFFNPNKDGVPYLYGQIDRGFLVHADGNGTRFYPLVDNNNSPSRAGITYEEKWWPNVTVFANVEASWNTYTTGSVSQTSANRFNLDAATLRKAEIRFDVDGYGRLWIGQGSTSSDGSAETDLSGTGVVATSSVADTAAGQFYAFDPAPGLSKISIGTTFLNLDGLGRSMRIRYDTPTFHDFRLSSSVGTDALNGSEVVEWDIAATYSRNRKDEDFAVGAALAFAVPDFAETRTSGSFSVLHKPTGLSLTLAGGHDEREGTARAPQYAYVKLGYAPKLTSLGPTAFSIDAYAGEDFQAIGSESYSFGLAAVQTINFADSAFDIYGVVRLYDYDDAAADYKDGLSFLTGVRWSF